MSLVVATGYKSGLILVSLPAESKFSEGGGISSQWLHKNWRKWVYPEAKLGDVWVALKGHPKPQLPK